MRAAFIKPELQEEVWSVEDLGVPGPEAEIPLRLYRPSAEEGLPVAMFFHGGGFTLNDLDTHDRLCRALANASGCAIVAVDYRLAPEYPFPTPIEDCYMATLWVAANADRLGLDGSRLALTGDSSGATCAIVVSLLAVDRHFPTIACQVLIYPQTMPPNPDSGSYLERGKGYSVDSDFVEWIWRQYCPDRSRETNPYMSPGYREDLSGSPKALILTAEFDPLRDEGIAFAEQCVRDGVSVEHWHADDQMHGFIMQTALIDRARELLDATGRWLNEALR